MTYTQFFLDSFFFYEKNCITARIFFSDAMKDDLRTVFLDIFVLFFFFST